MKIVSAFVMCLICSQLFACAKYTKDDSAGNSNDILNTDSMKLKLTVETKIFTATFYDNTAATAFKSMLPMTVNMTELNGNEKYFDLPNNLPANASNPGTIQAGNLMLYGSNTLVLFYKTFSTSYNYTKLGRIDNITGLVAALGSGGVTITFQLTNQK
jgi:hypothetical protein